MAATLFLDKKTRMDIQVRDILAAEVISQVRSFPEEEKISFEAEEFKNNCPGGGWYILRNVRGKPWALLRLITMLDQIIGPMGNDSVYIFIHSGKERKHVQKLGKEAGSGSEGGNR